MKTLMPLLLAVLLAQLGCTCRPPPSAKGVAGVVTATLATPLPRAHAHNDYQHPRPLLDALDQGFTSVEADVFLVEGELRVAHFRFQVCEGRTLTSLYLEPLRQRVEANGGRVHTGRPEFTLLVDIKSDAATTYAALRRVLEDYAEMLTVFRKDSTEEKAVTVILSGNRPRSTLEGEAARTVAMDGRLSDLDRPASKRLIPLISDRWSSHFSWEGEGPMPEEERAKLHRIVKRAHAQGRRVRFWATPEEPAVWAELVAADVDHIGTDELGRLRAFLSEAGQ